MELWPFFGHPQSWTVDHKVKKGSSPGLLCVACLWNPKISRLEHKYGRNRWKMSKAGQNSMKKWLFFAIILPWMASYGSEISFLLVFSATDDLVKILWKSDTQKCQNEVTPLTLTSCVKVPSPFDVSEDIRMTKIVIFSWNFDLFLTFFIFMFQTGWFGVPQAGHTQETWWWAFFFTLGSTVHEWGRPKNGPFWTKKGQTWQACQHSKVVQKGPKGTKMVNPSVFDH